MGQQKYLSTDPGAGTPLRGAYVANDPNAGEPREGESLRGLSATQSFFGGHQPTNESGQPDAAGFLDRYVNPGLENSAHPTSLTDMVNLLIPGQVPPGAMQSATGLVRDGAQMLGRGAIRGAAMVGDILSPDLVGVVSPRLGKAMELAQRLRSKLNAPTAAATAPPRLAGKAPTLEGALTDAVNEARTAPPPQSVSLPGGNTSRAADAVPSAGPRRSVENPQARAYSSDATAASAAPPASASGAPPAATPAAPARSTPPPAPSIRLTPEESQALQALVAEGYDEADVVRTIVQQRPAPAVRQPSVSGTKPKLNAAEAKEYQRLMGRGKSPEEAMSLIEQQRAFQQSKGLPTSEQTRRAVSERNATGRWD